MTSPLTDVSQGFELFALDNGLRPFTGAIIIIIIIIIIIRATQRNSFSFSRLQPPYFQAECRSSFSVSGPAV